MVETIIGIHQLDFPYYNKAFRRLELLKDEGILEDNILGLFHTIRRSGNQAVHSGKQAEESAMGLLFSAFKIAKWFYETYSDIASDISSIKFHPPEKVDLAKDYKNLEQEYIQLGARCGVAVLYTACLPQAPISGATWWKGKNPIIHLSGRYKTNDSFWFAFYHEAGHILKHGKKEIFLENLKGSSKDEEKEEEASQFAKKFLFPQEAFDQLSAVFSFDDKIILDFSREYHTHPAIIVGQLQFASLIDYSQFNHFKVPIELVN